MPQCFADVAVCPAPQVFAFTNHTVLPEALERWPVSLMEKLLPRHMQIIYDINWRFLQQMRGRLGDDWERISRMSIIEEDYSGEKCALALKSLQDLRGSRHKASHMSRCHKFMFSRLQPRAACSHSACGHSHLGRPLCSDVCGQRTQSPQVCADGVPGGGGVARRQRRGGHPLGDHPDTIFREFHELWPEKFQNKTNGVTPRRWLAFCNPPLRALITETLGSDAWITDLDMLQVRTDRCANVLSGGVAAAVSCGHGSITLQACANAHLCCAFQTPSC